MALHFITGNAGKFREVKAAIPEIEQFEIDLDEIQGLDQQAIIEHKLTQAAVEHDGAFIVEDTALIFNCLNGLPGTYIKWFEKTVGLAGMTDLVSRYDDHSATARTTIGYRDEQGSNHYFIGEICGHVPLEPRGSGFGWDAIFIPEGHNQTFGELGPEIKQRISMRAQAVRKLKSYLNGEA